LREANTEEVLQIKNENTTILNVKGSISNSLDEIKKINSIQIIF
jgi:hypothetical protein